MNMKYYSIIAFQVLALALTTFADPPPVEEEPPITSKEELVERLNKLPRQPTSWDEIRTRMRKFGEDHPEIMPLLPQLRDHPNGWVRRQILMIEIFQSADRNDVVRKALRSDDLWRRNEAMKYIGPLLGEPEFADPWLRDSNRMTR